MKFYSSLLLTSPVLICFFQIYSKFNQLFESELKCVHISKCAYEPVYVPNESENGAVLSGLA